MNWNTVVYGDGKRFCTWPTRSAKAGQKSLVPARQAQWTNQEGPLSFVIFESPFCLSFNSPQSCLGCSSQPSTKYYFTSRRPFHYISRHRPATWAGSRAGSPVSVSLTSYLASGGEQWTDIKKKEIQGPTYPQCILNFCSLLLVRKNWQNYRSSLYVITYSISFSSGSSNGLKQA